MIFFSLRRLRNSLLSSPAHAAQDQDNESSEESVTSPQPIILIPHTIREDKERQHFHKDEAEFDRRKCHSQG